MAGLKLWAHRYGADLSLEDDRSDPQRAIQLSSPFPGLPGGAIDVRVAGFPAWAANDVRVAGFPAWAGSGWGPDIVLGPYGSDSVRAVAASLPRATIWNHGAAADDVQQLPNVISVPSPSSRYLVALARAVAQLKPGASVAVVTAPGRFADYAWNGLVAEAGAIDLTIGGRFGLMESPSPLAGEGRGAGYDAILAIGPLESEIAFFGEVLRNGRRRLLLGGVSPGLSCFPQSLGADPQGFLAPVQWHADLGQSPRLGPSSSQVLEDAQSLRLGPLDYVAAQAYAAALIAAECHSRNPADPANAARDLHTSTFFGDFALDPKTGEQCGHQMAVIQWRGGRQELLDAR